MNKTKLFLFFILILCLSAQAQKENKKKLDFSDETYQEKSKSSKIKVDRSPKSQDEFKNFIYEKWTAFQTQKENGKKFPKLKKDDLIEILSYTPFDDNDKFTISYVRQVEDLDKATLYDKVYQSLVDIFVNAKNVMQMQDKETGIIICKGLAESSFATKDIIIGESGGTEYINFTLKIQVREGRYKIDLYDINTSKGTLDNGNSPIEKYLTSEFYGQKENIGLWTDISYSSPHYINIRTQVLLDQLFLLYQMEDSIFNNVISKQSTENDW